MGFPEISKVWFTPRLIRYFAALVKRERRFWISSFLRVRPRSVFLEDFSRWRLTLLFFLLFVFPVYTLKLSLYVYISVVRDGLYVFVRSLSTFSLSGCLFWCVDSVSLFGCHCCVAFVVITQRLIDTLTHTDTHTYTHSHTHTQTNKRKKFIQIQK